MVLGFLKTGFNKLKNALGKTASLLGGKIRDLFSKKIDAATLESLEEIFYEADLGVHLSHALTEKIQTQQRKTPFESPEAILAFIREELIQNLSFNQEEQQTAIPLKVILIVGINGSGKTTTTAKLAKKLKETGKKPLVAAADTFRAAAIDQLNLWAGKLNIPIVKGLPGSDPSAVAFDAIQAAKARGNDTVLIDTAGRLHTKTALMKELEKLRKTCQKAENGSPHEVYLVLDATLGQNALDQARTFHATTPLTGIILTKLDGTAKGGIALAIQSELKIPICYLGLGEGEDDLQPFDLKAFISALF